MRLPASAGERLDRSQSITFRFGEERIEAFAGDTLGSALYASGRRVFSRSFKYHRRRGLLCCTGHCPNCLMTVDGVPNVRVCVEPVREGALVSAQNVLGSLDFDPDGRDGQGRGSFTPVGFYYRTISGRARPGRCTRSSCATPPGSEGRPHEGTPPATTPSTGAPACWSSAEVRQAVRLRSQQRGWTRVVLVDEDPRPADAARRRRDARAGQRDRDLRGRARPDRRRETFLPIPGRTIVVATGAVEQPLVFPGNDLVGVMLPTAFAA